MRLHSNGGKSSLKINIIHCKYPSYPMSESAKGCENRENAEQRGLGTAVTSQSSEHRPTGSEGGDPHRAIHPKRNQLPCPSLEMRKVQLGEVT